MTLIFLRDRKLFPLQTGKETAAQSGSTGETTEAQQPDQNCATKLACQPLPPWPGNTPDPLGTQLPTGRPGLPCWTPFGITRLRSQDAFLHGRRSSEQQQLSTQGKSSPQVYRESPDEFACIKSEQNTNQHEMQRAEVFLSHVHTHTHTHTENSRATHI